MAACLSHGRVLRRYFARKRHVLRQGKVFRRWVCFVGKEQRSRAVNRAVLANGEALELEEELNDAEAKEADMDRALVGLEADAQELRDRLEKAQSLVRAQRLGETMAVLSAGVRGLIAIGDASVAQVRLMEDGLVDLPDEMMLAHLYYTAVSGADDTDEPRGGGAVQDVGAAESKLTDAQPVREEKAPRVPPLSADKIRVALCELPKVDAQHLLLRWANYHVHKATRQGVPYIRNVANFTKDLRDGVSLVMLLKRLAPELMGDLYGLDIEIDPQPRIEAVLRAAAALGPLEASGFSSLSHILRGDAYCNAAFLGALFVARHGLGLISPISPEQGDLVQNEPTGENENASTKRIEGQLSAFVDFQQAPFVESPLAGEVRTLVAESRALVKQWECYREQIVAVEDFDTWSAFFRNVRKRTKSVRDPPAHHTGLAVLIGEMGEHAAAMASFNARATTLLDKTRRGREVMWDLQTRITALQWQHVETTRTCFVFELKMPGAGLFHHTNTIPHHATSGCLQRGRDPKMNRSKETTLTRMTANPRSSWLICGLKKHFLPSPGQCPVWLCACAVCCASCGM